MLVVGWSLFAFAPLDTIASEYLRDQPIFAMIGNALGTYTPSLSLAGLVITIGIRAGIAVGERGISVKQDFFLSAQLPIPSMSAPVPQPLPLVPFVLLGRMLKRIAVLFYNAMVRALNFVVRCIVFVIRVVQVFTTMYGRETQGATRSLLVYAGYVLARAVAPLVAIYVLSSASLVASELIREHAFGPTWASAGAVLWQSAKVLAALFVCVICFAKVSPQEYLETFVRDLAAVIGYGIPILILCVIALRFGSLASVRYFDVDLYSRFGPLTWICLAIVVLGIGFLWRRQLIPKLRAVHAGVEENGLPSQDSVTPEQ